jgi:hypothetical protein
MFDFCTARKNLMAISKIIFGLCFYSLLSLIWGEIRGDVGGGIFGMFIFGPLILSFLNILSFKYNNIFGGIFSFLLGLSLLPLVLAPVIGMVFLVISLFVMINSLTYMVKIKEGKNIKLNTRKRITNIEYEEALKKLKELEKNE